MSEVTALVVHFIQVKNNFIYVHSKLLDKFKNSNNPTGCIELKFRNTIKFCSCNSTPLNSNGENALNICSAFAKTLGIKEFDTVIVSNTFSIKSVGTVYVSPISTDDWDILENAAEVVQTSLLNQIRVVSVHQVFCIWISKFLSLEVHVDKLSNGTSCGRLEQFTEIIVSPVPKKCENCVSDSTIQSSPVTDIFNKHTWDFLKDIFSFGSAGEELSKCNETKGNSCEYIGVGIFRCLSFNASVFSHIAPKLSNYPYNAFIERKYLNSVTNISDCGYVLCRLTHLPYASSKLLNDNKKTGSKDDVNISFGQPSQEIYVYLHPIDEADVYDHVSYAFSNCFPSIFISRAVQHFFSLRTNSKVKLDVCRGTDDRKLSEINFTVLKSEDNANDEDTINEIKNYLVSYAKLYDKLILNNYSIFTFDNFGKVILYFSFNPMDTPFVELNMEDINSCSFRQVKRDVNIEISTNEEKRLAYLPLRFLQEIVRKLKVGTLMKLKILRCSINSDVENSNHFVVEGDIGSGKTTIINMLCDELSVCPWGIYTKILKCKTLKGKLVSKLKKLLEDALMECLYHQPAVLCLDDLDVLFVSSKDSNPQQSENTNSSYSAKLCNIISDLIRSFSHHHITILASALKTLNFDSCLYGARGDAVFSCCLRIPILDQEMRKESFVQFLRNKAGIDTPDSVFREDYLQSVVERVNGYCVQDLSDLVNRIHFEALKRQMMSGQLCNSPEIKETDIDEAISAITPLSLRGIDLHKSSSVSWKDVGGFEKAKQLLTEILLWPSRYPTIFAQYPLKMQSGVLLFGMPGSGKTLLASAVAGESDLNFISIKGPELLSKFVGASEEGIRNIFRKAQNAKPCILFFDEFDSLAPRRGNDITGVTDRVVNQLLTELDGVESVSGVWILAATSRPDLIDPALLRPGRLGTLIHCPLPNQSERLSILKVITSSMDLANDVDLNAVARMSDGYTGADLRAVIYSAYRNHDKTSKLRESKEHCGGLDIKNDQLVDRINRDDVMKAFQETKPSLKLSERLNYEKIYKVFLRKEENFEPLLEKQRLTYA